MQSTYIISRDLDIRKWLDEILRLTAIIAENKRSIYKKSLRVYLFDESIYDTTMKLISKIKICVDIIIQRLEQIVVIDEKVKEDFYEYICNFCVHTGEDLFTCTECSTEEMRNSGCVYYSDNACDISSDDFLRCLAYAKSINCLEYFGKNVQSNYKSGGVDSDMGMWPHYETLFVGLALNPNVYVNYENHYPFLFSQAPHLLYFIYLHGKKHGLMTRKDLTMAADYALEQEMSSNAEYDNFYYSLADVCDLTYKIKSDRIIFPINLRMKNYKNIIREVKMMKLKKKIEKKRIDKNNDKK